MARVSRPIRMCAGCRGRDDKSGLIRIVARDGVGLIDAAQTQPGRGVYLHPQVRCLDLAVKRRSLGRALRAEVDGPRTVEAIRTQFDAVT